ncbi:hypothetical protein J2S09_000055 [Bacillus fengqiuensis]|nr:hypothetical protein [Bacillus fengqiuensis]
MKQLFISFFLFILVTSLITLLDLIQGIGLSETLDGFLKIKQQAGSEEYFLIFLFFLPLLISKSTKYFKNKQLS